MTRPGLLVFILLLALPARAEDPPQLMAGFRDGYPQWLEPSARVYDVAVHPGGDLFVLDRDARFVSRFHPDGSHVLTFGGSQFDGPEGITLDALGRVYVADTGHDRIALFEDDGTALGEWPAEDPSGIHAVRGVSARWLVTSSNRGTVVALGNNGTFLMSYPSGVDPGEGWASPADAVYDADRDRLYVSERSADRIQVLTLSGQLVDLLEGDGSLPDLREPWGLGLDSFGNLFVACAGSGKILKIDPQGSLLSTTEGTQYVAGLEIHGYGMVHVASDRPELFKYGYPPAIQAIEDIAPDQGGWLRLQWTPSVLDDYGYPLAVRGYDVYRRRPAVAKGMEAWDILGTVSARQDALYSFVAPTLVDSTATEDIQWSVFRVGAFFSDGDLADSAPDSGYSTDDLAPAIPAAPLVWENAGLLELELSWNASAAPDFAYYGVYRGTSAKFTVEDLHDPFTMTAAPGFVDTAVAPGETWYYRVAAFDDAGMVLGASPSAGAQVLTSIPSRPLDRVVLEPNVPNPFNPSTRLRFHLPEVGEASLCVYDAAGRKVATLLSGPQGEGWQTLDWTARDDSGRALASGVYYLTLRAAGSVETRKLVLSK